jgi:hypothetical protein
MTLAWVVLASWTAAIPQQSAEPLETIDEIRVYVELVHLNRSTREYWAGHRTDPAVFREWFVAKVRAAEEGSFVRFVEKREEADVLLRISRCQRTEDGNINIGGAMKIRERSEPFNSYMRQVEGSMEGLEKMLSWMVGRRTL